MKHPIILLSALTCLTATATADVLTIPPSQKAAEQAYKNIPLRGLTKEQVRAQLGEPESANAPVGDPPISSWEYLDFAVYFEYDQVLHTVLKQPEPTSGE